MATNANAPTLVDQLVDEGMIKSHLKADVAGFKAAMTNLQYTSVFDVIREPRDAFVRKLVGKWTAADQQLGRTVYDNALCYAAQASLVYRQRRLSRGVAPSSGPRTGVRSLVNVGPSYPKQFKEDWDNFCRSGALEAIDSPAAYLTDIVRFAEALEQNGDGTKITLDQRRPDIFAKGEESTGGLLIEHSTTFDAIPVLRIANEVVKAKIQRHINGLAGDAKPESIDAWFISQRYPLQFPYEDGYQQVRLGLEEALGTLLYRYNQGSPFSSPTHDLPGTPAGYALLTWSGLSPERQSVLSEKRTFNGSNDIAAFYKNFYGVDLPIIYTSEEGTVLYDIYGPEMKNVHTFLRQTELTSDALDHLIARARYAPKVAPNCGDVTVIPHGAIYVNGVTTAKPIAIEWPEAGSPLLVNVAYERFDRLANMIRLSRWTGMPFADLDAIVLATNQNKEGNEESRITKGTLRLLGAYRYFAGKYGINADEFTALFADLSPYTTMGQADLFNRTFNDPPLFGAAFNIDNTAFDTTDSSVTMLQLCAGLGMSPDERQYGRVAKYVKRVHVSLQRSLPVVSSFYRLVRGARLLGLECQAYADLLLVLGGEGAVDTMARGDLSPDAEKTIDSLDYLVRLDWIVDWLKASGKTVADLAAIEAPATVVEDATAEDTAVEDTAAVMEMARRIHQGIPATLITTESISSLGLPAEDDSGNGIPWDTKLAKWFDQETGLVAEIPITLATPADAVLRNTIETDLAGIAFSKKTDIVGRLTDVIASAWQAQSGLLEAELSHELGLSPELVVLTLTWSGASTKKMLEPLMTRDGPTKKWSSLLGALRRHARAVMDAKLSPVALHTFVAQPKWFAGGQLSMSAETLYQMYRYREWLNSLTGHARGSEDDVIRYLAVANNKPAAEAADNFAERCAGLLAPLLGWSAEDVLLASDSQSDNIVKQFDQIERLLRLAELSDEMDITIQSVVQIGELNSQSTSPDWEAAGNVVVAAAKANWADTSTLDAALDEARRDAFVGLYLAEVAGSEPGIVGERLKSPNDLYEYLLIDTQVTQAVRTTRVASAITSVQQYINRILLGMESGYAKWQPDRGAGEISEQTEWRDQKSQYPLWAANQQLRYFPELYIDPSLRLGKSRYFEELEQEINQNRIHLDTVQQAVLSYLGKFEEVANLTIVNGYATTDDFANATYYFVGKSRGENKYYWRSVDMSQRPEPLGSDHKGDTLNPSAWSDWNLIDLPVSEATVEHTIRPVFFNDRLFVTWVDWYPTGTLKGDTVENPEPSSFRPTVRVNAIYKKYDDTWSPPNVYIDHMLTKDEFGEAKTSLNQEHFKNYAFYDQYAEPRKLFLGVYARNVGEGSAQGETDYRMLRNVTLDVHFRAEPYWPGNKNPEDPDQKTYALAVFKQFANSSRNHGRIQFAVGPGGMRQTLLDEQAPAQWNQFGSQSAVTCIPTWVATSGASGTSKLTLSCALNRRLDFDVYRIVVASEFAKITLVLAKNEFEDAELPSGQLLEGSFIEALEDAKGVLASGMLSFWHEAVVRCEAFPDGRPRAFSFAGFRLGDGIYKAPLEGCAFFTRWMAPSESVDVMDLGIQIGSEYGWMDFPVSSANSEASNSRGRLVIKYAKDGAPLPGPLGGSLFTTPPGSVFESGETWSTSIDIDKETLLPTGYTGWKPIGKGKRFQVAYGIEMLEANTETVTGYAAKYLDVELEPYSADLFAPKLSYVEDSKLGRAEYLDFAGSSIECSDGLDGNNGSNKVLRPGIRMNTLFVQDLISRTNVALENLLDWETQHLPEPLLPGDRPPALLDFKGANGKYFWELFFHLPFSIAHRFHQEQQFADSDRWLQFIFDPNYKGDPPGEDRDSSIRRPYWMVRPLDRIYDATPDLTHSLRAPFDPDGQASAYTVHYRKAVYFLFIRNLLLRGDWAYRELTPDSLNEAKLWYVRALDLLGPRPDIMTSDRWMPAKLGDIVASRNGALRSLAENMAGVAHAPEPASHSLPRLELQPFTRDTFISIDDTAEQYFRVPFNRKLVELWDQLESRLYNLRHNRTIDGKPFQLPIFAPPLDPSALLARFAQGGTSRSGGRFGFTTIPHYRYQTVQARASQAMDTLIQFGQLLLSLVERKEQAGLVELQQSQLWEMSQFAIDLQEQMQAIDDANQQALQASKRVIEHRKAYYDDRLRDGGVSAEEVSAAALHMTGRAMEGGAAAAFLAAYCLKALPNVFGLANGGQDVEGPPEGIGASIIGAAQIVHGVAESLDRAAQYKRRREEWELQRDEAVLDMAGLDEQINVLAEQRKLTRAQLEQARLARDHTEQMSAFIARCFTGSALYGWLASQLSTFYYQAYDTTLSMCLAAEACWQFEIGDFTTRFVEPGKWKDAYRGLTVGEGLKLNLLKMDAAYLNRHERLLVIGKTMSVKAFYEAEHGDKWEEKWNEDREMGRLEFKLTDEQLTADYNGHTLRRIRRVGVSIPAVVGAYQDIRAVLTQTRNRFIDQSGEEKSGLRASQQIVVSRGIDDDGMMAQPMDDRYLPFEGTGAESDWSLEFSDPGDAQKALLESLNDVILHVTYTARPGSGTL